MSYRPGDEDVRRLVQRLLTATSGVADAQAGGLVPGNQTAVSSPEVMATILWAAFGESVIGPAMALSRYSLAVSRHMIARGAPPGLAAEWVALVELARGIGDAFQKLAAQRTTGAGGAGDPSDLSGLLEVVRLDEEHYARLAVVLSAQAVATIRAVALALDGALGPTTEDNPLTMDERDLLRRVVTGATVEGIAEELGLSPRTVYRRLQDIWTRIGAESRLEGIAIVSMRGWLD